MIQALASSFRYLRRFRKILNLTICSISSNLKFKNQKKNSRKIQKKINDKKKRRLNLQNEIFLNSNL